MVSDGRERLKETPPQQRETDMMRGGSFSNEWGKTMRTIILASKLLTVPLPVCPLMAGGRT